MVKKTLLLALFALVLPSAIDALPSTAVSPDASVMKLDEIGVYEIGFCLRDRVWHKFPVGWSGYFDERIGIACEPHGSQGGKAAFLLHPPWKQGAGTVYQQFTFNMPWARKITLRGATAMRSDITDKTDGVVFRVYVNGSKKMETLRKASSWQPFQLDLTHLRSKTVTVRFETDSGAADNPGWDFALWSGRQIELQGFRPKSVAQPNPPPLDLSRMHSQTNGSVVPLSGFDGAQSVAIKGDTAILRYSGSDGILEYRWTRPLKTEDPVLGSMELRARMAGHAEVVVPLAGTCSVEWTGPPELAESRWEQADGAARCISTYKIGGQPLTLSVSARIEGKSLAMDVSCDQPAIRSLDAGGWGPVVTRRQVTTPYYTGKVSYLVRENLFANSFLDWTSSRASSHDGSVARYQPTTEGALNPLRERIIYTAAWHLAETLPNIPNPPSPFIGQVGNRIVLDVWGGRYVDIARKLETLHDYGIRNCVALIHVWQRSGYDNALPAHIPADASLGGDDGMKVLVETGKRLGYIVALHENYVDYYPNYDDFTENHVSLDPSGKRINAWYNPGTKIQSFAVKPNAILPLAKTQSPEIHKRYGTNGCYLDVHSAVPPWFHVDFRAGEQGVGTFERVWNVHRELWDYERRIHGGPVFGEGNCHWYWSGLLDGVEAQFGSGWPYQQGETAPLAVDFDLLKVHPLQINHGMGYYERWSGMLSSQTPPSMFQLDQYRVQEVVYGHAGFLSAGNWSNVPHAWLEHHLLSPVTARHSQAKPVGITYRVDGKWVDGSAAAKAGVWTRPRIEYDNGLILVANSEAEQFDLGGLVLPQFGWLAKGAGITAYTALRDGVVVDYAETADSVFANARNASLWNARNIRRVRPAVGRFEQTGPREFRIGYLWFADEVLDRNYHCFVHFTAPSVDPTNPTIDFQNDHAIARPTSEWKPGETITDGDHTVRIPDEAKDGDYLVVMGLFDSETGRVPLLGSQDSQCRIRVGVLKVRGAGKSISFEPDTTPGDERLKLYSLHVNQQAEVIDFGTVRTNGSILIERDGGDWVLRALPRERPFEVRLSESRFGLPLQVRCIGGSADAFTPIPESGWWSLTMNGAKEYRWPASPADPQP